LPSDVGDIEPEQRRILGFAAKLFPDFAEDKISAS
jgi:hypothetical protein